MVNGGDVPSHWWWFDPVRGGWWRWGPPWGQGWRGMRMHFWADRRYGAHWVWYGAWDELADDWNPTGEEEGEWTDEEGGGEESGGEEEEEEAEEEEDGGEDDTFGGGVCHAVCVGGAEPPNALLCAFLGLVCAALGFGLHWCFRSVLAWALLQWGWRQ